MVLWNMRSGYSSGRAVSSIYLHPALNSSSDVLKPSVCACTEMTVDIDNKAADKIGFKIFFISVDSGNIDYRNSGDTLNYSRKVKGPWR